MITRRFEYIGGGSDKFWEVTYPESGDDGTSIWTCRWGRRGTDGQEKGFAEQGWRMAQRNALGKITEKLIKGYIEVGLPIARPHLQIPITQAVPYISPRSGRRAKPEPKSQPAAEFDQPKRRKIVLQ